MTDQPTSEADVRLLIGQLRMFYTEDETHFEIKHDICDDAADALESLLSDRARLEERVRVLTEAAEIGLEYIIEAANGWGCKDQVFENMMRHMNNVSATLKDERMVPERDAPNGDGVESPNPIS